jgi:tRNA pseudouridine13 synthase
MTSAGVNTGLKQPFENKWLQRLRALAYAHGSPKISGQVRSLPEDFRVTEVLEFEPSGQGEHYWVFVTKTRRNTDQVAKALARFAGVAVRDIGYSGLKDYHAITSQWFSVRVPVKKTLSWRDFAMDGVEVEQAERHYRKIKRGTHRANKFELRIRSIEGDRDVLAHQIEAVQAQGAPNYYGPQRFGNDVGNMPQAYAMLVERKAVGNRHLRSLLLSSARSWLFNQIVSTRIKDGTWTRLFANEPVNLNGNNSVFFAEDIEVMQRRLSQRDIHTTAPLYGKGAEKYMQPCLELYQQELKWLQDYPELIHALETVAVDYQRRATRLIAEQWDHAISGGDLFLTFELQRGQFATSLLRELVTDDSLAV